MGNGGLICQACGIEAPTRHVEFHQNIGALVMRFHRTIKGNLCKRCVHTRFWSMTLTTIAVGWLGFISIIIAPIFILNNIIRYLMVIGMPAVPPDALPPEINQDVLQKFMPTAHAAFDRVNAGEKLEDVAAAVAPKLGLTPGQVIKCMITISQQARATR